ncbi:hypothetical protein [Tenacibaculum halocynthiae]|uniref:hypothetical protein n=1 Tax=Tenacibaculum halocynthiae TaxID=1254437 RepID=UPI003D654149
MIKYYLLFLFFCGTQLCFSQLNGTYTIGEAPSDYNSIKNATEDLIDKGVSGPVIFNLKKGTYNESNIYISAISGVSATNTVTFQSETQKAEDVTIDGNNIFNAKEGAQYLIFKHLRFYTYSNSYNTGRAAFLIYGENTSNISISHCVFEGGYASISSNYFNESTTNRSKHCYLYILQVKNLSITNNVFGSIGTAIFKRKNYYDGYAENVLFSNNTFKGSIITPMYMSKVKNLTIAHNHYTGTVKYRGLHLIGLSGTTTINANKIFTTNKEYTRGTLSTYLEASIADGGDLVVKNNFISQLTALGTAYFKTVQISNNSFFSIKNYCLDISGSDSLESFKVHNNIFYSDNEWANIGVSNNLDLAKLSSQNNAFNKEKGAIYYYPSYTPGDFYDVTDWKTFSNKEQNSLIVNDLYVSHDDFHTPNAILLNGAGLVVANVNEDIDGEVRDTTNPDIGADEFDMNYATYLDLEITDIITPTLTPCDNSEVLIAIKNNSKTPVNSFEVEAAVNDFRGNVEVYNMTIEPNETIQLSLNNFSIIPNTQYDKIEFFVSKPNELLDHNYSNNHKSILNVFQLKDVKIVTENSKCVGSKDLVVPLIQGVSLLWSTGETTNRISVDQPGTYTVTITDQQGCQTSNSITIN